ncbi:MAG TPA: hypothetical protein VJB57_21660 [Dehalococcoidia bacterium]|nr:hypothetical protein [Dehalococcoidia bacterium]
MDEEWRRQVCALRTKAAEVPAEGVEIGGGVKAKFRLASVEPIHFPGPVDSNSPAFWSNGELVVFNSFMRPQRSTGPSVDKLGEAVEVSCSPCDRGGGRWLEAVWKDESSNILYGWYHFEPDDLACQTAPIIGAAISRDEGRSWQDQGTVLASAYPIDCSYQNGYFAGGHGDFTVILDEESRYFYFLFSTYDGPLEEQGVAVARSSFAAKGQPGTAFKHYKGEWNQPGVGGRASAIFASPTGWKGPFVDAYWGPSVHWNPYLERYVALLNRTSGTNWQQEGVYITFSSNLFDWTAPRRLFDANTWYPQVIGIGPDGTDRHAGRSARVYVGGISVFLIDFER